MFRKPLLPGLIWTLVIALLTMITGNYVPKVTTFLDWLGTDKLVHLLLFGIYAYLFAHGLQKQSSYAFLQKHALLASLLVGMVFAFFTEVMQANVIPGRNGNAYDFLADVLGCLLGILVWHITRRK